MCTHYKIIPCIDTFGEQISDSTCAHAVSGFCDYSQTEYQGQLYTWPESVGRDVVSFPCLGHSGHMTRMCGAGGVGWLLVNTRPCDSLLNVISEIVNFTVSHICCVEMLLGEHCFQGD